MKTWIGKMVAWQQRFVRVADPREPRLYWDGRARRWNLSRNRALVPIEAHSGEGMLRPRAPGRYSRFIE